MGAFVLRRSVGKTNLLRRSVNVLQGAIDRKIENANNGLRTREITNLFLDIFYPGPEYFFEVVRNMNILNYFQKIK